MRHRPHTGPTSDPDDLPCRGSGGRVGPAPWPAGVESRPSPGRTTPGRLGGTSSPDWYGRQCAGGSPMSGATGRSKSHHAISHEDLVPLGITVEVWPSDYGKEKGGKPGHVNLYVADSGVMDKPTPQYPLMHDGVAARPCVGCSRKRSRGARGLPAGPRAARGCHEPCCIRTAEVSRSSMAPRLTGARLAASGSDVTVRYGRAHDRWRDRPRR